MLQLDAVQMGCIVWRVMMFPLVSDCMRTNIQKFVRSPSGDGESGLMSGLSRWGNKGMEWGKTGLNAGLSLGTQAGNAIKEQIPVGQYACKQQTDYGLLDRWVSVTPDTPTISKLKVWGSYTSWKEWAEEALDLADHEKPELPFEPYALRDRSQYKDKLLAKIMTSAPKECTSLYKASCAEELMSIIETKTCAMVNEGRPVSEAIALGSFNKEMKFCSKTVEPRLWRNGSKTDVVVSDNGHILPDGQCVVISTLDPSKGIDLTKLDADLMGSGFKNLASDLTKMERLARNVQKELNGIVNGLVDKAGLVVEAGSDVVTVVQELNTDLRSGADEASDKSMEWIKRLTLSTEVDTCLCCDQEEIDKQDKMASHCLVAYTLGGEDKNKTVKHTIKTIAGTLYNLAHTAGNWLVPFLGANIVSQSHSAACRYVCDLRKPHLYEPYSFGQVRKVPGLAMQTWFIPNPRSFYSSATGTAASATTEAVVEGATTNVIMETVT
mmetsp:Transcript_70953/g.112149  ORF Transcript_70953/g.112149 Transcript_70953/m.112149 type:complete len:495 (+) Transcript_70953:44-1528(+)